MKVCYHTYAVDAAKLITNCRQNLHEIISFSNSLSPESVNPNIIDLDRTLLSTEQFLHYHLLSLIDQIYQHEEEQKIATETGLGDFGGMESSGRSGVFIKKPCSTSVQPFTTTMTLMDTAQEFKRLSENERERQRQREQENAIRRSENISAVIGVLAPSESSSLPLPTKSHHQRGTKSFSQGSRSATDSLLFRLIVILQLCQVRIDESKSILCTRAKFRTVPMMTMYAVSSIGTTVVTATLTQSPLLSSSTTGQKMKVPNSILVVEKGVSFGLVCLIVRRIWRKLCMNTRLLNTSLALEDWQQQWMLIQSVGPGESGNEESVDSGTERQTEEQCKRLLQLMPFQSQSSVRMAIQNCRFHPFFSKIIY